MSDAAADADGATNPADGRDKGGRERLLRAAYRLFAEKGFENVRAREVAEEAGVTHGLIRHHFGSMEGLRLAVCRHEGERMKEQIARTPLNDPDNFVAELLAYVDATYDDPEGAERRWMFARRSLLDESDASHELFDAYADVYEEFVAKRTASSRARDDLDPRMQVMFDTALNLGSMLLEPYFRRRYGVRMSDPDTVRRMHRYFLDVMDNGILKR
jgi:AcrR family transcriptional regulator